jgi:hypothetical protein
MPTFVLVGIPAAIILVLGGLVVYERYTENREERKRVEGLKRWMGSQDRPSYEEHPKS